jgi:mannose-1-phosphate guanylyltransferase
MLQLTCLRIKDLDYQTLFVICNEEHIFLSKQQIEELNITNYKIIGEPFGKNTCAAIATSCILSSPESNLLVMTSDHIWNDEKFVTCVKNGLEYTNDGIVVFGIKPTYPETGYGYIKIDENSNTIEFVEKPILEVAQKYFEEGNYLWNAGIFAFKNKNMISCFQKYASGIYDVCVETLKNTNLNSCNILLPEFPFINCKAISVDYSIMENLCNDDTIQIGKKTILYNSTWNDIGSYMALFEELEK